MGSLVDTIMRGRSRTRGPRTLIEQAVAAPCMNRKPTTPAMQSASATDRWRPARCLVGSRLDLGQHRMFEDPFNGGSVPLLCRLHFTKSGPRRNLAGPPKTVILRMGSELAPVTRGRLPLAGAHSRLHSQEESLISTQPSPRHALLAPDRPEWEAPCRNHEAAARKAQAAPARQEGSAESESEEGVPRIRRNFPSAAFSTVSGTVIDPPRAAWQGRVRMRAPTSTFAARSVSAGLSNAVSIFAGTAASLGLQREPSRSCTEVLPIQDYAAMCDRTRDRMVR